MAKTMRQNVWGSFEANNMNPEGPSPDLSNTGFISGSPGSSIPVPTPIPQKINPPVSSVAYFKRRIK